MSKFISALKRTLVGPPDSEPTVHFHQGTTYHYPEVCHQDACDRPRLQVR